MTRFDADVVVIGAGPAGTAAAIAAARGGADVLLLDRAAFPRDKPCGDLIGARALKAARSLGIDEEIVRRYARLDGVVITTDSMDLPLEATSRPGRSLIQRTDARVIPRQIFDTAMVAAALRTGVQLATTTVRSVGPWDETGRLVLGIQAGVPTERRAKIVIVAGGYACQLAADVANPRSSATERPRGIAMRGYLSDVDAPSRQIVFSLNRWMLPGYGWLFPLPGGTANVGVGTLVDSNASGGEHLHDLYHRFISDPGSPVAAALLGATATAKPRTWPLDLGPRQRTVVADGLLVAGEAASLVGPMTGAGIAFALESGNQAGLLAARAIKRGDWSRRELQSYDDWVRRHPLRWLRIEARAHTLVSDPNRLDRIVRTARRVPPTGVIGAWTLLNLG